MAPSTSAAAELPAISPGDHVCVPFTSGAEVDDLVAASFADGIAEGDCCLLVSTRSPGILERMGARGVSVNQEIARGALVVIDPDAFYHSQDGSRPSVEDSLAGVARAAADARSAGFRGLRGAGGPWCYDHYDDEEWRRHDAYESRVNEVMRSCGASGICLYERPKAPARCLEVMLRTHPSIWLEGCLRPNPFCDPSARPSPGSPDPAQVDWMLRALSRTDLAAAAHPAAGRDTHLRDAPVEEIDSRDALMGSFYRQLQIPTQMLSTLIDEASQGGRTPPDWLDRLRDTADGLGRLTRHLDAASRDLGERTQPTSPTPSALSDLGSVTRAALEAWIVRQRGSRPEVKLTVNGSVTGAWETSRLETIVTAILDATWERGWGTKIELQVEDLGSKARLTAVYGDMEVMAGYTLDAGQQERLLVSARDSLRVSLWVARENARVLGGTLGLSVWPDARVSVTLDLPKKS